MSWTPEHCRRYTPSISHIVRSDAIDPPSATGRPRLWSTLVMLQALWWLSRSSAAWCLLPAVCPPRQVVGSRLECWVRRGVLDRALAVLNSCLRLAKGRKHRPPAGILDAQSVRAGPQCGPRGYDAGKRVKGRKRVLLVDTQGLVQVLEVVPASAQDRDAVASVELCLAKGTLLKVWADRAFNGKTAAAPIIRHGIDLELVGRKIKTGFAGRAQAMVGRGNLGILVRYRRLLVDHEGSLTCLVT